MDFNETLRVQRAAWERRPLVRHLYREWYGQVADQLASVPGPTIELGSGIGAFKEFHPAAMTSDAAPSEWAEQVLDAEELSLPDGSVGNLVLIDVLHHLPRPARFFREASRVLQAGGRVVLLEPYCSPVSTFFYKRFHHERTDLSVDPFGEPPLSSAELFDSNQALATLIFWRCRDRFAAMFPELEVRSRTRLALFAYPVSGGFTKPPLLPAVMARPTLWLERRMRFAAGLLAFRCLVTLERHASVGC